jgi:hypothetical protein
MVEVFEVAPSIFMVELQRAAGDTSEYNTVRTFLLYTCLIHIIATDYVIYSSTQQIHLIGTNIRRTAITVTA